MAFVVYSSSKYLYFSGIKGIGTVDFHLFLKPNGTFRLTTNDRIPSDKIEKFKKYGFEREGDFIKYFDTVEEVYTFLDKNILYNNDDLKYYFFDFLLYNITGKDQKNEIILKILNMFPKVDNNTFKKLQALAKIYEL